MSKNIVTAVFNDAEDLSNFLDQFDDVHEDLAIDDANLNDLFPAIWTAEEEERSFKLNNHSDDNDFDLQDALVFEAGMSGSDNNQPRSVSPVSVLNCSGSYPDLAKTVLTTVPVQGRARTKRCRQSVYDTGDLSNKLVPVGWTWAASVDEIRKSAMQHKMKTKKHKLSGTNEIEHSQNKDPNYAMLEGGFDRKCTHCEITKTPQWRLGPLGPKTLCNACGVRYKSGRLFPEYRPAASPTFSPSRHSNSHRKVVEMRKKNGKNVPVPAPAPAPNMLKADLGAESHLVPVSVEQVGATFTWA